jgi:hypothetical protein
VNSVEQSPVGWSSFDLLQQEMTIPSFWPIGVHPDDTIDGVPAARFAARFATRLKELIEDEYDEASTH